MFKLKYVFFINSALIILGIFIGLFSAEAILFLGGKVYLNWESSSYDTISNKYSTPVKTKKNFRILCLGDSSTYGLGEKLSYSYPCQLSKLLNQRSSSFEVTVISAPGINTSQIANRYDKFLRTGPYNVVIFQAGVNDVHHFQECHIPMYTHSPHLWEWLSNFRLLNLIKTAIIDQKISAQDIDFLRSEQFGVGTYLFLDNSALYELFQHNLRKIIAISRKYNVELWVQDYHTKGWGDPQRVLSKVYSELGLEVVHQEEIFDYGHDIRMRGKDNWHPNSYGYFVIARLIYNNMIDHGIIQGVKYDLHSEIDKIRGYIKNKKEGYQFLVDDGSVFDEKNFVKILKNIVTGFEPDIDAGMVKRKKFFD